MILTGASAVVTGGAVRIGRAIARSLAEEGMNVCIHYGSSEAEAATAVNEFTTLGVRAMKVRANLQEPLLAAKRIFEEAQKELGEISVLINSAAIFEAGTLENTGESNWDRHLNINLKAPFALTQAFVKHLNGNSGAVVNLVDWRGKRPLPGHLAYTVAKAGLVAQTQLLAQELGPQVRVNGIAPGAILPAPGESWSAFQAKKELNPLKTTGSPQEIAQGVLYLLRSNFVTGEILHITGGQQLGSH